MASFTQACQPQPRLAASSRRCLHHLRPTHVLARASGREFALRMEGTWFCTRPLVALAVASAHTPWSTSGLFSSSTPFSGTSPLPLGLFPLAHAGVLDVFLISDSVSLAHYLAVILSSLSRHHATILQPSATKPSPQFLSSLCHVAVMPRAACLPCRLALAPKEINAINTAASPSLAPHARQSHPRLTTSLLLPVSRASTHVTQLNLP